MIDGTQFVTDAIAQHPVLIFSKTYCPFCDMAKTAIADAATNIHDFPGAKIFELDTMGADGPVLQTALATLTGRTSVPNVFIGGENIGGGSEVSALHGEKKLAPMLQRAVAQKPTKKAEDLFDAKEFVMELVKEHSAVIFSKSYCPFCSEAKDAIAAAGQSVESFTGAKVLELDEMGAQGALIQTALTELTGRKTVPNVFIRGTSVGGGSETMELHSNGELMTLLSAATSAAVDEKPQEEAVEKSADAKTFVADAVTAYPAVIFSKSYCPFCDDAKTAVARAGVHIPEFAGAKVVEIDEMGTLGVDIQTELRRLTGRRTVPNVFIGGTSVGGGDEVRDLAERKELEKLIALATGQSNKDSDESTPAATDPTTTESKTAQDVVDSLIATAPVAFFSKSFCGFCDMAKQAFAAAGPNVSGYTGPNIVELDELDKTRGEEMQAYLAEKTGQSSVPNVFIEGKHIGGFSDVQALADSGELVVMLEKAFASRASGASEL